MALKNKVLAAGLLAALTTLGSAAALAHGNAREIQGDFLTVEMKFARHGEYSSFNYNQVLSDYRAEINKRVMDACKGRNFAIDTSRVAFDRDGGPFLPPPVIVYGAVVMAFCEY